uniref:Proline rich membrane anchor 1 n=1 Tax=Gadus morhua TaxID=8049 RepID=A0A8C5FB54_GADMO
MTASLFPLPRPPTNTLSLSLSLLPSLPPSLSLSLSLPPVLSLPPFLFFSLSLSVHLHQGELQRSQRSCSQTVAEKVSEQCQLACHCRRYPPLPPPPPPPPPPRLLEITVVEPVAPLLRPWWMEMEIIVLGTVGCASVVFLLSAIIICYKAIKRWSSGIQRSSSDFHTLHVMFMFRNIMHVHYDVQFKLSLPKMCWGNEE